MSTCVKMFSVACRHTTDIFTFCSFFAHHLEKITTHADKTVDRDAHREKTDVLLITNDQTHRMWELHFFFIH